MTNENEPSSPTIDGLLNGKLWFICWTCGAAIPECDLRELFKRVLQEVNPEMFKKLFGQEPPQSLEEPSFPLITQEMVREMLKLPKRG